MLKTMHMGLLELGDCTITSGGAFYVSLAHLFSLEFVQV